MDEQFGPMLWEDILRMARDGALSPTDSIRRETGRRWKHLDQMLLRTPRGTNPANDAMRPAAGSKPDSAGQSNYVRPTIPKEFSDPIKTTLIAEVKPGSKNKFDFEVRQAAQ